MHSMTTLLDPRFKSKGFSTASFVEIAKSLVLDKVKEMNKKSGDSENLEGVAPRKKPRKESCLWEAFEKGDDSDTPLSTSDAEREIKQYFTPSLSSTF